MREWLPVSDEPLQDYEREHLIFNSEQNRILEIKRTDTNSNSVAIIGLGYNK